MEDLDISLTAVLSAVGWVVGVSLTSLNLLVEPDLGSVGVVFAVGAATLNVRGFFCRQARREANAFALGRDYEASRVRPLR